MTGTLRYKIPTTENAKFEQYVSRGRQLQSDEIIKNIKDTAIRISADSLFCCLVLPSLTGKTQSAFALDSKVLYFNFASESQEIYLKFQILSTCLERCAELDLQAIGSHNSIITLKGFSNFMAEEYNKSYVLGYLKSLIDYSTQFNAATDWMTFYTSPREIEVDPINIIDWLNFSDVDVKGFIVILDEFPTFSNPNANLAVLVRSMLRFLCFPCIVMGTNITICNLVGDVPSRASGGDSRLWCMIFCNLPGSKESFLEEFEVCANTLSSKNLNLDENFLKFFVDFLRYQMT